MGALEDIGTLPTIKNSSANVSISVTLNPTYANDTSPPVCYAGGFAGYSQGEIENCTASGPVYFNSNSSQSKSRGRVGGFIGSNSHLVDSKIQNCFSSGKVEGTSPSDASGGVGGFVGYNNASITNILFDKQGTGQANGIGTATANGSGTADAKSTAELTPGSNTLGITGDWEFLSAYYPQPEILTQDPAFAITQKASALSATPVFLANSETSLSVETIFKLPKKTAGAANADIQWEEASGKLFFYPGDNDAWEAGWSDADNGDIELTATDGMGHVKRFRLTLNAVVDQIPTGTSVGNATPALPKLTNLKLNDGTTDLLDESASLSGTFDFNVGIVSNNVSSVTITGSGEGTILINGSPSPYLVPLNVGQNTITVTVTKTEAGTIFAGAVYTITLNREAGATPPPDPDPGSSTVPVTGIRLDQEDLSLASGSSVTLKVTFTPSDATNKSVTWKSSDTSVATVDQNGKVTAVGPGTCVITATTVDGGKMAECTVTVTAPILVTGITLNRTALTLKPGQTFSFIATILPENATNKNVTWTSTYPGRVTVDENGKITAVTLGSAVITVTTEDGEFFASCMVLVSDTEIVIDFSDLKLEDGVLKLEPGQEVDVTIGVSPEGTTFKATGLPAGLTLTEDGHLYGYAPTEEGTHTVTVTATAPDGTERTATFTVTVRDGEVIVEQSDGSGGGCNAFSWSAVFLSFLLPGLRKTRRK